MNKTITEMKTSEGVDSRIAEAELISDMEDRMVEISAMEQNLQKKKKKNEIKWRQSQKPLGQCQLSNYRGRRKRQRVWKYLKRS